MIVRASLLSLPANAAASKRISQSRKTDQFLPIPPRTIQMTARETPRDDQIDWS